MGSSSAFQTTFKKIFEENSVKRKSDKVFSRIFFYCLHIVEIMSNLELQEEEIEALSSIYDGDPNFVMESKTKFQYKFGEDGASKSFILELSWGPEYPEVLPDISTDSFYNKHVIPAVKSKIADFVKTEGEMYLGMSMTFTIFEQVKENIEDLLADQPDQIEIVNEVSDKLEDVDLHQKKEKSPKKENLTKAQKRAMWKKGGLETEDRPRGWNWIDVIRHLSQTGGQQN